MVLLTLIYFPMIRDGPVVYQITNYLIQNNTVYNRTLVSFETNQVGRTFRILWYAKQPYFFGTANYTQLGCKFTNCILTEDTNTLNISDVVLFAYRDMSSVPIKKYGQIWVIVNIESPANDEDLSSVWDGQFDWSMTYRRDSEVLLNYQTFKREVPLNKNYHEIYKNKTKSVSWAVSNCYASSQRGKYVEELRKYIDVDIYGKCGSQACPGQYMPDCHEILSQNYKFYLGFENSLCKDYATEKLFHTFLDNSNTINVYRGAPNIKSMLPPKTYIDTLDFANPKALAEYLLKLGSNEAEYISYLKETDKYHIDNERNYPRAICDLCQVLNTNKTYNNLEIQWTGRNFNKWFRTNVCIPVTDI